MASEPLEKAGPMQRLPRGDRPVGLAAAPGGPADLPLWSLSSNGHADDHGVLGQNLLEKMFKIIF